MSNQSTCNKCVCIINGKGGCGKDYLVELFLNRYAGRNVSSISPVKAALRNEDQWNGEKTEEARALLAETKERMEEVKPSLIDSHLHASFEEFMANDREGYMFVHIREPKNILKFKEYVESKKLDNVVIGTMMVTSPDTILRIYGNSSDDKLDEFCYDLYFTNFKDRDEDDFNRFKDNMAALTSYLLEMKEKEKKSAQKK